jgi:hypothetical protein
MNLDADMFSGQGDFSILGQKKPTADVGGMRPVAGVVVNPSLGSAVKTADGISLPTGIGTGEAVDTGTESISQVAAEVTVPFDVLNDKISVSSVISHGPNSVVGSKAALSITVECLETSAIIASTTVIPSKTNRANIELISEQELTGAGTQGNRIKVRVTRMPTKSLDDSKSSVIIHDLQVNFNRSALPTNSLANQFSQFS